ncbi:MAG: hypothetical protein CVT67_05920 [Actinobacteria bacterium HGW-Actinobacteria-7]|nr:MAG: hypothetical protein CVT67_05920 [Actinobacteria bacterium HGW-Actinobacteria-7]
MTVTAIVPAFLLAAIEALADDPDGSQTDGFVVIPSDEVVAAVESGAPRVDDTRVDAYCEYFRRQLSQIDCVDDAVAEMDSPARS